MSFLPWSAQLYLEDYGPIILDCFLAIPLVLFFRRLYTQHLNRRNATLRGTSLPQLPDELLLEICKWIVARQCPRDVLDCNFHSPRKSELLALSNTNRRLREVTAPILFKEVLIRHRNWPRATRSIYTMEKSLFLAGSTKDFYIDLGASKGWGEPTIHPPKRLPQQLAIVLSGLAALESLTFVTHSRNAAVFRTVFSNRMLTLPTVRSLVLSPDMDWLIFSCPNVQSVIADPSSWRHDLPHPYTRDSNNLARHTRSLIDSAAQAKHLQQFQVAEYDSVSLVREIKKTMPHLRSLGTFGALDDVGLDPLMPLLASFEDLRILMLAEVAELGVGYNPPRCGNVYLGPGGREYQKQVEREGVTAMENVRDRFFNELPKLTELWIGDYSRALAERDASGKLLGHKWVHGRQQPSTSYRRLLGPV